MPDRQTGTISQPQVLFVSATVMEVQSFVDAHDCRRITAPCFTLFHPRKGNWACLVTGPGVFNTAAGLGACLARGVPDRVIDVGIAGVFAGSGMGIGDLALADSETYVHTGVGDDLPLPFDLIPGMAGTRDGAYAMDGKTIDACRAALASKGLDPLLGPFLTVSTITETNQRAVALRADRPYVMENMEGAAAAHVCARYNLPMAEVRAGSNVTGDRNKSRWDIPAACRALDRALTCLKDVGD